jgi:hypothetical protein
MYPLPHCSNLITLKYLKKNKKNYDAPANFKMEAAGSSGTMVPINVLRSLPSLKTILVLDNQSYCVVTGLNDSAQ